jgi:hypothetical protein
MSPGPYEDAIYVKMKTLQKDLELKGLKLKA